MSNNYKAEAINILEDLCLVVEQSIDKLYEKVAYTDKKINYQIHDFIFSKLEGYEILLNEMKINVFEIKHTELSKLDLFRESTKVAALYNMYQEDLKELVSILKNEYSVRQNIQYH